MKIRPLDDYILIQPIVDEQEEDEKTVGGIIIAQKSKAPSKPTRGVVIEAGVAIKQVKKGEVVLFDKYAGNSHVFDGQEYYIFTEDKILAVLDDYLDPRVNKKGGKKKLK